MIQEEQKHKGIMPKSKICDLYGFSPTTLSALLNKKYFEILEPLGYKKTDKNLSPAMYEAFREKYGPEIY